jgi:hypothetical protein
MHGTYVKKKVYCRYFEVLVFCASCTENCASLKKSVYVHRLVHVCDQMFKGKCLVCILVNALLLCLELSDVLITLLFFCALPFLYMSGNVHSKLHIVKGYMIIDLLIADSASLRTWFHSSHLNRRLWDHLHSILLGWDPVTLLMLARKHIQQLVTTKVSSQEFHSTVVVWFPHIQGDMIQQFRCYNCF